MIILLGLCSTAQAQINLVPNGGFESHAPFQSGDCALSDATSWFEPGYSPDYFNADRPSLPSGSPSQCGVPDNNRGYQSANSGIGYAGIHAFSKFQPNGREFIQIELLQPIHTGVRYEVSFFVSLADDFKYAVKTLGAYFSPVAITQTQYEIDNLNIVPQIVNASVILDSKDSWQEVRDTFVSRVGGGERFLVIGNFNLDVVSDTVLLETGLHDHSYYYIDDVSVVAIDSVPSSITELEEKDNGLLIYPNPNNGLFTLTYGLNEQQTGEIQIFDMVGKKVFAQQLNVESNSMHIDFSEMNAGIYLIRLEVNGQVLQSERISIVK